MTDDLESHRLDYSLRPALNGDAYLICYAKDAALMILVKILFGLLPLLKRWPGIPLDSLRKMTKFVYNLD